MILIIQNGHVNPQITKYLKEKSLILKSKSIDPSLHIQIEFINNFSVIIILGGHQSVRQIESEPCLLNVLKIIEICSHVQKPVVGFCLGFHLITHFLGSNVRTHPERQVSYCGDRHQLSTLIGSSRSVTSSVLRCHYDYVVPDDSKFDTLYVHEGMAYIIKKGSLVGTQFHPDITPDSLMNYGIDCPKTKSYAIENEDHINWTNEILLDELLRLAIDINSV